MDLLFHGVGYLVSLSNIFMQTRTTHRLRASSNAVSFCRFHCDSTHLGVRNHDGIDPQEDVNMTNVEDFEVDITDVNFHSVSAASPIS